MRPDPRQVAVPQLLADEMGELPQRVVTTTSHSCEREPTGMGHLRAAERLRPSVCVPILESEPVRRLPKLKDDPEVGRLELHVGPLLPASAREGRLRCRAPVRVRRTLGLYEGCLASHRSRLSTVGSSVIGRQLPAIGHVTRNCHRI